MATSLSSPALMIATQGTWIETYRVKNTTLFTSRVDNVNDVVDGNGRLGDVGCQDNLANPGGKALEDEVLLLHGQLRVEGEDPVPRRIAQVRDRPAHAGVFRT